MREIKFRGKRVDNREWIYGSLLDGDIIVSGRVDVDEDYIGIGEWCSVDPETVGQYTMVEGYRDGKLIYVGDIVDYHRNAYRRKRGVVKFGEYEQDCSGGEYSGTYCIGFYVETIKVFPTPLEAEDGERPYESGEEKTVSILEFDYEIIGNIHDNPELLEMPREDKSE